VLLTLPIRDIAAATPRARIVTLDLDGQTFDYAAGQAVVVALAGSGDGRPYSIAAAPEDAQASGSIELLVGVDADGRAGPHLPLEVGVRVDIEGPVGTFTFPAEPVERDFVFVAGGTGIAPLRAMVRHAVLGPVDVRHAALLYSARTPDEFAYATEFRTLAARGLIEFRQTVTRGGASQWSGARGRIDRTALAPLVHSPESLCFVCGPMSMVDEIPKLLEELGIAKERIRIEEW